MEHAEARELLEVAAVEPRGFERLAAGDTIDAAALAGHLAGCESCAAEMARLSRDAVIVRDAVRSLPAPELRDRTLAFVAAVGRPRDGVPPEAMDRIPVEVAGRPVAPRGSGRIGRAGLWAASLAAVFVLAVAGTVLVDRAIESGRPDQVAALSRVATWTLRIDGQPDAQHIDLRSAASSGPAASGTLLFSASSGELVVLAEGLPTPPAGQEYRCWMEIGAERTRVGKMFFAGDLSFWVGEVENLPAGGEVRFGVTLVPAAGDSVSGEPVLLGES